MISYATTGTWTGTRTHTHDFILISSYIWQYIELKCKNSFFFNLKFNLKLCFWYVS